MSAAVTTPRMSRDQALTDVVAEGISVGYGRMTVLRQVSFAVRPGECIGLLGPNGAGKTTLLNCLAGLLTPSAGRIVSGGRDITSVPVEERRRRGLSLVQEGRRVFSGLTVHETLTLAHETLGMPSARVAAEIARIFTRFPSLEHRRDVAAGLLSGGEQQMLCLARAMACGPSVLLIDEPFMGLAPLVISLVMDYLKELRAEGVTMVIADESRVMLERLGADRLVEIHALDDHFEFAATEMEAVDDR